MQQIELQQKARTSAERAAVNDAKQKILFQWHRNHRPMHHNVFCTAQEFPIYRKAVLELNEQYSSTIFRLYWHK